MNLVACFHPARAWHPLCWAAAIAVFAIPEIGLAQDAPLRPSEGAVAVRSTAAIQIDGLVDVNEWADCDWVGIGEPAGYRFTRFAWKWDDSNLYFAAVVRDRTPLEGSADASDLASRDTLQLGFDPLLNAIPGAGLQTDDIVFYLARISSAATAWVSHVDPAAGVVGTNPVIRTAISKRSVGEGYAYEAAIPWSTLGIVPAARDSIGVDLLVNDGRTFEGAIERHAYTWSADSASLDDPSAYRRVYLAADTSWYAARERPELTFDDLGWRDENDNGFTVADPTAHGGDATHRTNAGGYVSWNFGRVLPPGNYDIYARVRGTGTVQIRNSTIGAILFTAWNRSVDADAYQTLYLGRVVNEGGDTEFRLTDSSSADLWVDWVGLIAVEPRTAAAASAKRQALLDRLPEIATLIAQARSAGMNSGALTEVAARYEIAKLFAELLATDLALAKYDRTWSQCDALLSQLDDIETTIERAMTDPSWAAFIAAPPYPPDGVLTKKGERIYRSGRPHIGIGIAGFETRDDFALGMIYNQMFASMSTYSTAEGVVATSKLPTKFDPYLDPNAATGVHTDFLINNRPEPAWITVNYPDVLATPLFEGGYFPYAPSHPDLVRLLTPYFQACFAYADSKPACFSVCLGNETYLVDFSVIAQQSFRSWAEARYGTIAAANTAWGANIASFAALSVTTDIRTSQPGIWYDFIRFNEDAMASYMRQINDLAHVTSPRLWTHIKLVTRNLEETDRDLGVDRETLNGFVDLIGLDGSHRGTLEAEYDLVRSFTPDKPLVNSEYHLILGVNSEAEIHGQVWNHALHGMAMGGHWKGANTFDPAEREEVLLQRTVPGEGDKGLLVNPLGFIGLERAGVELRRLAPYVVPFWSQRGSAAIYYSHPSKLLQGQSYDDEAIELHTAFRFSGLVGRFISDRQLAAGAAAQVDTIFVPHADYMADEVFTALQTFAAAGGHLVLIGECGGYDEHGKPRSTSSIAGAEIWGPFDVDGYRSRILSDARLAPVERPRDFDGSELRQVEWRIASLPGRRLLYLQNFGSDPVSVVLPFGGVDLITGEQKGRACLLEPYVPLLISAYDGGTLPAGVGYSQTVPTNHINRSIAVISVGTLNSSGVALVAVDPSAGEWEWRQNPEAAWLSLREVDVATALLLGPTAQVRVSLASGGDGATARAELHFYPWDGIAGQTGDHVYLAEGPASYDGHYGTAIVSASLAITDPGPITLALRAEDDAWVLSFTGDADAIYGVEYSDDLLVWHAYGDPLYGTGQMIEVLLPSNGRTRRFYRVQGPE